MRGNELLCKMELMDPIYIEAAEAGPKGKRKRRIRRWAAAACFCAAFGLAAPILADTVPAFYAMLYRLSPATAQFFQPVRRSCQDNGIRMEVEAAYIREDTAEIYISMQDLEGGRLDETTDLFDSYRINTPSGSMGHCQLAEYDRDTQTATFLITIEPWEEQSTPGDKITFSVRKLLIGKKRYEGIIEGVNLAHIEEDVPTQTVRPRGISGIENLEKNGDWEEGQTMAVLKPSGSICVPTDGVTLTGIGYVDDCLHVQVYYEDILNTDNHGTIFLTDTQTGAKVLCDASISFFDQEEKGSYEDYIFPGMKGEALGDYELCGEFVTSAGSIEGNWSVTFSV